VRGGLNLISNSLRVSMEEHGGLSQWASSGKVVSGMVRHSAAHAKRGLIVSGETVIGH
jgi:hypothetical protein